MADPDFIAALRASASEVLDDQCSIERVRHHVDSDKPFAADLWRTIVQLGWTTIAAPEAFGGLGGGVAELAVLQEALGAHLAPLPFLGTALLALGLAAWPDAKLAEGLVSAIVAGEVVGGGAELTAARPLLLSTTAGELTLDGEISVFDGLAADWLLAPIVDGAGVYDLVLLPTSAAGLERIARPVADRSRSLVSLTCRSTPIEPRQRMGEGAILTAARLTRAARLLLASDAIGGADAILAATVEYLKTRVQFGKPIGSFQALKHRAADLKVSFEMSRALLGAALDRHAADAAPDWAAMAKTSACETYVGVASEAVQMHGGIGFTWEHQAHLFLKRATLNRALFGNTAALQDQIALSLRGLAA